MGIVHTLSLDTAKANLARSLSEKLSEDYEIIWEEVLSEEQADDFLKLQKNAENVIKEEISVLQRQGLTNKHPLRPKYFKVLLVYKQKEPIAYAYCHLDGNDKSAIYINTLYVDKDYRGNKIGRKMIIFIINDIISNALEIDKFKANTQPSNDAAIGLLESLGFGCNQNK